MQNFFVKSHGLGNDYIVLDHDNLDINITPEKVRLICDYHYGIGSDGILMKRDTPYAEFGLRIFNPDGSEAEKSGNGLRIFAKYLYDYKFAQKKSFTIHTLGGVVTAHIIEEKNGRATQVKVDMGKAIFKSSDIPVSFSKDECFGETLAIKDKQFNMHCVSVGNPHCVILVDSLNEAVTKEYGPLIENHSMFPNRINVQFAKVLSRKEVEISIWERGAGYTLASGSSSSAVACAMYKKGLVDGDVTIKMPGGNLHIEIDPSWNIKMTGEVREIASGSLSSELFG
jgi:diaminopimelate epimerase